MALELPLLWMVLVPLPCQPCQPFQTPLPMLPTYGDPRHTLAVCCIPSSVLLSEVTAVSRTDAFLLFVDLEIWGGGRVVTLVDNHRKESLVHPLSALWEKERV